MLLKRGSEVSGTVAAKEWVDSFGWRGSDSLSGVAACRLSSAVLHPSQ